MREFLFVLDRGSQALGLGGDRAVEIALLRPQVDDERMRGPVAFEKFRLFLGELVCLLAQGPQITGAQIRHVRGVTALGQQCVQQLRAGLLLGELGAGLDEFGIELGKLLLIERQIAGLDKAVRIAELRDRLLRSAQLLTQFVEAIVEPARGPPGGLEAGVELVHQVGVGDRVRQPRRPARIGRGDGDGQYKAELRGAAHRQRVRQRLGRRDLRGVRGIPALPAPAPCGLLGQPTRISAPIQPRIDRPSAEACVSVVEGCRSATRCSCSTTRRRNTLDLSTAISPSIMAMSGSAVARIASTPGAFSRCPSSRTWAVAV